MTIQHHINFQDAGERTQRRSDMLLHIQGLMLDLAIGYQLPPDQKLVSKLPLREPSEHVKFQVPTLAKTEKREEQLRGERTALRMRRPTAAILAKPTLLGRQCIHKL
ncbi:hypothetical protein M758_4G011000 [Ceratodon purpureus]|uniref:Uncharacterized protein n=1 Tax=Ceratodon purpureus TaxID=3225 RepID=A0A8T0I462_CERPU|nr:hypothetical protein KC19_4G012000 [Ceratodon purpureus]KAG0617738.1 hypothetical protein M758_4G011000 [Ceratodon purpureus]